MIVGYTPQLPQKGSPNDPKSLFRMFRSPEGMHPTNWLLRRHSHSRLVRSPNSAGISPVSWFSHEKLLRPDGLPEKVKVKRRCRTVLQSNAEELSRGSQPDSLCPANAHLTLALV